MLLKLKRKEELVSRQIHTKKPYRNVDSPLELSLCSAIHCPQKIEDSHS